MKEILNRYHKMGILLLCVVTLGLLARFVGASGTLTASDGATYDIAVTYGAAAGIPAGARLEVAELSGARYQGYYDRAVEELGRVESMRAFDIRCVAPDGTEIEPSAPVKVAFRLPGNGHTRILHFVEGGGVVSPSLKRSGDALDFETDSFSVYAVVGTVSPQTPISLPLAFNEKFVDFTADIFPAYLLSGPETAVAKVSREGEADKFCDTLSEALTEAQQDGDTITLLKDVTGHFIIDGEKTLTLDLGGHTLTVDAEQGITSKNGGTLTIINSETTINGKITSENKDDIIYATSGGKIVLGSGLEVDSGGSVIWVHDGGSVVIEGATVTSTSTQYGAALVEGNGSSIEVISGTLSATCQYTIKVKDAEKATISGGIISNDEVTAINVVGSESVLEISGGTVHGVSVQNAKATITGGTFTSNVNSTSGGLTVSGGKFTQKPDSSYIASYCRTFKDEHGYTHVCGGLTITANSATKVYDGTELTDTTYTVVGELMPGESIHSVTVTGSQTNAGSSANVPGGAVILDENGANVTANYVITYVSGTLEVTPKPVTVTADNKTKVLGEADPELTATVDGLVGDDTITYTVSREKAGEDEGEAVGEYTITPAGDATQGNYTVTYEPGTLTITEDTSAEPISVTVKADDVSKTYGEADPALTATVTVNGQAADLPEGVVIAYNLARAEGENVGQYAITPTGAAVQGDYIVTYEPGTLTITPAAVTVTAENKEKVYGDADPEHFTATVTGLVGEDTISYSVSRVHDENSENVGEYTITPSGEAVQGNYNVSYVNGTFTIDRAAVTVTAKSETKVYGAADPELTATVEGLQNGDEATVISYTCTRAEGENVGTYDITASGETEQGNYNVSYVNGTFTIDRAAVTVTADDKTKVYGDADPEHFTATVTGLQNGDAESVISYTCTRAEGEDVGTYDITASGAATQGNYTVTYEEGTFKITPAEVTVTPNAGQTKVYGEADPELTATVTGLQNGDAESVISYTCTRAEGENVGTYAITASGAATQGNYTVNYGTATFTITPAEVTVTAENKTKVYGTTDDPPLTATVEGLKREDAASVIQYTISRVTGETVGEYAVTVSGEATQGNYKVEFVPGVFTITKRAVTVTIIGANTTAEYNGTEYRVSDYSVEISDDLYTLDDFTFTGTAEAARTDAGTTYMGLKPQEQEPSGEPGEQEPSGEQGEPGEPQEPEPSEEPGGQEQSAESQEPEQTAKFVNNNSNFDVTFDITDGYVTITPIDMTVSITGNCDKVDYNGEEQSVSGYTAEAHSLLYDVKKDFTFSGTAEAKRTDAGTTQMGLAEEQFTNINPNFDEVTFNVTDGYLTIDPITARVNIKGNQDTTSYDGEPHTVSGYTVTIEEDSPYKQEYIEFSGTAEATCTDVGKVPMGLNEGQFTNKSRNFETVTFNVTEDGYQEITPFEETVVVTITGHSDTVPYDGQEHSVTGFDVAFSTELYKEADYTFAGIDEAKRTEAGTTYMNLSPEFFSNNNNNFQNVTFVVEKDGCLTINPTVVVSKKLDDLLATTPETFTFRLTLRNDAGNPEANYPLTDDIRTNEEGVAGFTLAVSNGETVSQTLSIPWGYAITVAEDEEGNVGKYTTWIDDGTDEYEDYEASLDFVTDNQTTIAFTNIRGDICRIEDKKFQTLSSAVEYVNNTYKAPAFIEMLTDYAMPVVDKVLIPSGCDITLCTASEYEGESAVISRAPGNTGVLFTNEGTLTLGDEGLESQIILDGEGVPASDAMILNHGILNVGVGATIRNADIPGDGAGSGGAIRSSGTVNISGGLLENNSTAANGGAIYATGGAVNISGGTITGNRAMNGGAVFAASGATVHVTGGTLSGNSATTYGGAIYVESGVTVAGDAYIGGTEEAANRAVDGAAIFVASNGVGTFEGGEITGNVATDGGAVGIATLSATLNFKDSPKIINNVIRVIDEETGETEETPANVCLSQNSANIINALGLTEGEAKIGIYVPGNDELYRERGLSRKRFGKYTVITGINAFSNDRVKGMQVSGKDDSWLTWGTPLTVEVRYLSEFSAATYPPTSTGENKGTVSDYYPTDIENYVSDIGADSLILGKAPSGTAFACAFLPDDTAYNQCLSQVNWNNITGNWQAVRNNGGVEDVTTLMIYYAKPAYMLVANNTDYPLDITSLCFQVGNSTKEFDALSDTYRGYGFVVAENGSTVKHFVPLSSSDLHLEKGKNIKLMFPGVRNRNYKLQGTFRDFPDGTLVDYSYYDTAYSTTTPKEVKNAEMGDFTISGKTFNDNSTIQIVFGTATKICKIVDRNGEEYFYSSLKDAVDEAIKEEHYDVYKVPVTDDDDKILYHTVKIELLQDYLIPSGDTPDIPEGKNFTFTTADSYSGSDGDRRAKISRDQGNPNSFITVDKDAQSGQNTPEVTLNTALTVENLRFDGKQVGSDNGGVIRAKNCSVTLNNCEFTNFKADDGGAIYVGLYTGDNCKLYVSDCDFAHCVSTGPCKTRKGGGAIWTTAGYFELIGCTFAYCEAYDQGGAVFHRIDAIENGISYIYDYRTDSRTVVKDCTFEHCKACAGGGLEIDSYHATVENTTFFDCQATRMEPGGNKEGRNGGAFNAYLQEIEDKNANNPSDLSVKHCTFTECFASQSGGAFRTTYKETTVQDCEFKNNTANGEGGNNTDKKRGGGGIAQTNGNEITLDSCLITGNKSGSYGGGVFANGDVTLCNGTIIKENSLTINNPTYGGGVYIPDRKKLTVGFPGAPAEGDTIIVRDNTSMDGSPSNIRLWETNNKNAEGCVIVRSHLSTESELCVLNANAVGTKFGIAEGVVDPRCTSAFHGDNDTYGKSSLVGALDRSTTGSIYILWRGKPVCKVTDGEGNLLYFDETCRDPAVFDHLDNGTATADYNGAFSLLKNARSNLLLYRKNGDSGEEYSGNTFCVKMLIPKYKANNCIMTNKGNSAWESITLTTAGRDDADSYPYKDPEGGTTATIIRDTGVGNNDLFKVYVNMTLTNITIDGGSQNGIAAQSNTRIVGMDPGSATTVTLTIGNNATLKNASVKNATLQYDSSLGNGAGVYLNWGSSLKILDGGRITNCVASGNGGGVYKNGGNGKFFLKGGSIDHCEATNGGGVYIYRNNENVYSEISSGSITNCEATESGGGVFVANANDKKSGLSMSGGSIQYNRAGVAGGGIAVINTNVRLNFSGNAVVYDNTKTDGGEKCNVELNQNSNQVINAGTIKNNKLDSPGLGEDALIGVYVPDENNLYETYGGVGDIFGTRPKDNTDNLFLFVNDRNGLRGWQTTDNNNNPKIYWVKTQSLTVRKEVDSVLDSDKNGKNPDAVFHFTVNLHNENIDNSWTGSGTTAMTFTQGVAEFDLKHGEYKTALYIPMLQSDTDLQGSYTITETQKAGFTAPTIKTSDGQDTIENSYEVTGTFDAPGVGTSDAHNVLFTNKRETGSLTIGKTVRSDLPDDQNKSFSFTVRLSSDYNDVIKDTYGDMHFQNSMATVFMKHEETKTASGLPVGIKYTVTETYNSYNPDFTPSVNGKDDVNNAEGTLQPDDNLVQFTNTRKKGGLKIVNRVNSDIDEDKQREFTFTVTLPDNLDYNKTFGEGKDAVTFENGVATVKLKHGDSKELIGLPPGAKYTVTQESVPEFQTTSIYSPRQTTIKNNVVTWTFTNTRKTGRLIIYKDLVTDLSTDKNIPFTFQVTLGDENEKITKTYKDVAFENGVATVSVMGGSHKTIAGLPAGIAYKVEEINIPENFTLTSTTNPEGNIVAGDVTARFQNTRDKGQLKISKTVENGLDGDANTEFRFNVRLGGIWILSKSFPAVKTNRDGTTADENPVLFTIGAAQVTLKDGQSITISDLPTSVTYTVTETRNDDFKTTSDGASGTITKDLSEAKFTNTRQEGVLRVEKKVNNYIEALDENREFTFIATLSGGTVPDNTYGEGDTAMTFENGVARFTLKHNQHKIATGLPRGVTYTVTEAEADDFTANPQSKTGTINQNVSSVTFQNTRKSGSLILTKEVVSPVPKDRSNPYTFTIQLGVLDGDGNFVQKPLGYTYIPPGSGIRFNSDGKSDPFTITPGVSKTISLPHGLACKVIETPVAHMTTTVADAANEDVTKTETESGTTYTYAVGEISKDTPSKLTFTNTRETGSLTVSKEVVSPLDADKTKDFEFTITLEEGVTGVNFTLHDDESLTVKNLPVGVGYTVTEKSDSNFETESAGDSGTITKDEIVATFKNTRKSGQLTIEKKLQDPLPEDETATYHFNIELGHFDETHEFVKDDINLTSDVTFSHGAASGDITGEGTLIITELPYGVAYKVSEEPVSGMTSTGDNLCSTIGADSKATFTNSRDAVGSLKVIKTVENGLPRDAETEFDFTVTLDNGTAVEPFKLKGGGEKLIENLPVGVGYTVTETPNGDFTTTSTGASGTISETESVAAFTNTRKTGALTVIKTVFGDETDEKFHFTVTLDRAVETKKYGDILFTGNTATFTLEHHESVTATDLPTGIGYTVTEETNDDFITTSTGETGTINATESVAAFSNTRKTDGLTVTKTVVSPLDKDKTQDFTFTVELNPALTGTYGELLFTNGKSEEFTLQDGKSKTFPDLPKGVGYTVTETPNGDFTTTSTAATGTIGRDFVAAFTNTRKTGALTVSKTVFNAQAGDNDIPFKFTVTLTGDNVKDGTYGEMEFTNGVSKEFELKHNGSKTATGLPIGITYEVKETPNDDFTTTPGDTLSGTISVTKSVAAFSNTRKTEGLTVTKTVVSPVDKDKTEEFTFTVTKSDGTETFKLKHGESKTFPEGIGYTVTEEPNDNFDTDVKNVTIGTSGTVAAFTNTRKTGTLKVSKKVENGLPGDEFDFTVTLDNGTAVEPFKLKGGGEKLIENLPVGVGYTVTEKKDNNFTTAVTGSGVTQTATDTNVSGSGTIGTDLSEVTFINTRKTGTLKVTKKVVRGLPGDEFDFTVTLDNGTAVEPFKLKGGEEKLIENLPVGVGYTVTEKKDNNFTTAVTGSGVTQTATDTDVSGSGTISTDLSEVTFTNTRNGKDVVFRKVDGSGEKGIQDAVFTLYSDSWCREEDKEDGFVVTSDNEGYINFDMVPQGVHYMKETAVPEDDTGNPQYVLSSNKYIVLVGDDVWDKVLSGTLDNVAPGILDNVTPPAGDVAIFRLDEETGKAQPTPDINSSGRIMNISTQDSRVILRKIGETGNGDYESLEGVAFEILRWDKTLVASGTSQSNGVFWVGSLPHGTYYLHEKKETIPPGYKSGDDGNWFRFTVDASGASTPELMTTAP